MAKTKTTATDNSRAFPTNARLQTLAVKATAYERAAFTVGDAAAVLIPRDVAHWRHRSISGETVKEGEVFDALAALCPQSANTLIQWRNVATAFPKSVRVDGVSFAAHKYLASLAWKDGGARRADLVEWMKANMPTADEAKDHAALMRLAASPPTDPPADDDNGPPLSASEANGPAATTCTGDELVALVNGAVASHDGSDPTDLDAARRAVELFATAVGWVATRKEGATV